MTVSIIRNKKAESSADTGIVSIHAQTMVPAIPQRTAVSRLVDPTPTIAPVMVWVVLTGIPATDAPIMAVAVTTSFLRISGSVLILDAMVSPFSSISYLVLISLLFLLRSHRHDV